MESGDTSPHELSRPYLALHMQFTCSHPADDANSFCSAHSVASDLGHASVPLVSRCGTCPRYLP